MNNQKKRFRRYRKYKCLPHCDILLITIRWFLIAVFAFFGLFCAVLTAFSLWKTVKLPIGCPFLIDNYLFSWCFYFVCRLTISVNGIGRVKKRLCFNWRKLVFGYPTPDIFSVRISCCTPFKREQRAKNCFPGFAAKNRIAVWCGRPPSSLFRLCRKKPPHDLIVQPPLCSTWRIKNKLTCSIQPRTASKTPDFFNYRPAVNVRNTTKSLSQRLHFYLYCAFLGPFCANLGLSACGKLWKF